MKLATLSTKERKVFSHICQANQSQIFSIMRKFLIKNGYTKIEYTSGYLIAEGEMPIGLVAHADTVFSVAPYEFFADDSANVMWSPQGLGADDRAGIYGIMRIIQKGYKPHIIITADEEKGCIGASKLVAKYKTPPFKLNFLIQLDRRGEQDSVYYDCGNDDFEEVINKYGFVTAIGSFSDISIIAPAWDVAAVNFSVGYFHEHSYGEYLHMGHFLNTLSKVEKILIDADTFPAYDYQEVVWSDYWNYTTDNDINDYWKKYTPKPKKGEEACYFCADPYKTEQLVPLSFSTTKTKFKLCPNCFDHAKEDIGWCSKCGHGFFLSAKDKEKYVKNPKEWKCQECSK